jgi:hypothetical protein
VGEGEDKIKMENGVTKSLFEGCFDMRKIHLSLFFMIISTSSPAQTIMLGPITKVAYCVGDTMVVPYEASGAFGSNNFFYAQLSDASGSFSTFTNFGHDTASNGSISIILGGLGSHYRVRVASGTPAITSLENDSDIEVERYPNPTIIVNRSEEVFQYFDSSARVIGLTGEPVHFQVSGAQPGDSYFWHFNQDASISASTIDSPEVVYDTAGIKSCSVTVTNIGGCSVTLQAAFLIASCTPVIPSNVYVVKGDTANLNYRYILVPAGASYHSGGLILSTIFVESGGSLTVGDGAEGVVYLLNGASITIDGLEGPGSYVVPENFPIGTTYFGDLLDSIQCGSLSFDYSQLSVAVPSPSNLTILQSGDHLLVNDEGLPIEIRISNILGAEVLSQSGSGAVDVDLSALPAGVYFSMVEAGNDRAVKRIAVVH